MARQTVLEHATPPPTLARRLGETAYTAHDKLDAKARVRRLAVERQIAAYIPKPFAVKEEGGEKINLVEKVLVELAKRFKDRPGGYTRVIKFGPRRGDGAPMVGLELVEGAASEEEEKPKKKKAKKAAKAEEAKAE